MFNVWFKCKKRKRIAIEHSNQPFNQGCARTLKQICPKFLCEQLCPTPNLRIFTSAVPSHSMSKKMSKKMSKDFKPKLFITFHGLKIKDIWTLADPKDHRFSTQVAWSPIISCSCLGWLKGYVWWWDKWHEISYDIIINMYIYIYIKK
jgi:hypothetical protein